MKHPLPRFRFLSASLLTVALALGSETQADVRLPGFFGDHMVLQQKMKIRVWGWADAGELVTVSVGQNSATATPNDNGRWQVELPPLPADKEPQTLTVRGNNTIEIKDVLIGEIWLCSGQSNMEWPVQRCTNAAVEIAATDYPLIRHMKVPLRPSTVPLDNIDAPWQVCSPETAGSFTACGFFMARHLHKELNVPIGLINSSWGGTRVEPWTPPVGFQHVEALQDIYQSVIGRTPGTPQYRDRLTAHITAIEEWLEKAQVSWDKPEGVAPNPVFPAELVPFASHQDPTMLYNAMIHALVGFPIRGAIWYQGESNHGEGMLYFEKKRALINGWRELWGQGDFPFYYVQIAPFQYGIENPEILAKFWEAQAAAQQIPNTGMVVINDIATLQDIHPPNKQDVGLRLALLALKNDYGRKELVASGPEFNTLEVLDDHLKVNFKNTGGGLKTRDGNAPSHFEVVGPGSSGFQSATAKIDGDAVILTSESVKTPVAFRFAWHKLAEPNLVGGTGLPMGAVRGGKVPDFLSMLPIANEYKLVYDLDLSRLNRDITYDVNNAGQIKAFDRIGYLLELAAHGGNDQQVFVSMNAFSDDVTKIGIPTVASQATFQQAVEAMDVYSNVPDLTTGTDINTGNIEFWPHNYAPSNGGSVSGASAAAFDFGDEKAPPVDGYGCMQVHNFAEGQTLFAINHWNNGPNADIGIGSSSGNSRDWTFAANAGSYSRKRLRIFVREK